MLSNKLTFSLVFIVMLALTFAFVATPAMAQSQANIPVPNITATTKFIVLLDSDSADDHDITDPDTGGTDDSVELIQTSAFTVDLEEFLRFGGTIELLMQVATVSDLTNITDADKQTAKDGAAKYTKAMAPGASDADKKATHWNDFVITEIMWGQDAGVEDSQWIEIYNNAGAALPTGGALVLKFYPNERTDDGPEKVRDDIYVLVDRVSAVNRFKQPWTLKGQSGNTSLGNGDAADDPVGSTLSNLVSMYRTVDLSADGTGYKSDKVGNGKFWNDGTEAGSWAESVARANISGYRLGSPLSPHKAVVGGGTKYDATALPVPSIIINEVRNDTSEANLDWIELFYNTEDTAATSESINDWELSIVTSNSKDDRLALLPNYKMKPGEYLVIYRRDPGPAVKLAGGINIQDAVDQKPRVDKKGATHKYVVSADLDLPSTGKFLILLRSGNDKKKTGDKIVDYAGNGFFAKGVETDVWPFVAWTAPSDSKAEDGFGDNTFASMNKSYGRIATLNKNGDYWAKSRANRVHNGDWQAFEFMGAGYARGKNTVVDRQTSPGTPGYPNVAINVIDDDRDTAAGTDDYVFDGEVSISEIMYDAGPHFNLVQWIELYNSSLTETIKLDGWELEIRNEQTDIETYVDTVIEFVADTYIPPNQTLLLVSSQGVNEVPPNAVYNLAKNHPRELGVKGRAKHLLSQTGFNLKLYAKIMEDGRELGFHDVLDADQMEKVLVDEVGNVTVKGADRTHQWDLPSDGDATTRVSIIRTYGTDGSMGGGRVNSQDGTSRDAKNLGTAETSWIPADNVKTGLVGASFTYYGHRDDVGSPGHRIGSALPVSLSSFRPVRDDVTGHVVVRWATESELNNAGFNILRSETKNGEFKVVNVKGIIAGHGTTSEKHVYEWTDTTAKPNVVYYYQIEDVSLDGKRTTLTTTRLKGHVSAAGKLTTTWSDLKQRD